MRSVSFFQFNQVLIYNLLILNLRSCFVLLFYWFIDYVYYPFKGIVSVMSIDTPYKDGIARFTMVPLKPKSDQKCGRLILLSKKRIYHCKSAIVILTLSLEIKLTNIVSWNIKMTNYSNLAFVSIQIAISS